MALLQLDDFFAAPKPARRIPENQRPQVKMLLSVLNAAAGDEEFAPLVKAIIPAGGSAGLDPGAMAAIQASVQESLSRNEAVEAAVRRMGGVLNELRAARIQGNGQGGLVGSGADYPRRLAIIATTRPEFAGCRVAMLNLGPAQVVAAGSNTFTTTGTPTADVALGIIFADDPQGQIAGINSFGLNGSTRSISLFSTGELGAECMRAQSQTFSPFQSGFAVRGRIASAQIVYTALGAGRVTWNFWGLVRGSDVGLPAGLLLDKELEDCSCPTPPAPAQSY